MDNPFNISFGIKPEQFISRISQTNQVINTFRSEHPSSMVYILTGVRGSGKTVMMTSISESLQKENEWIIIELNPERDMLTHLAASLYAIPDLRPLFLEAKLDFSALGLGVRIENSAPVTDAEVAVDYMFKYIRKAGKKVLITVDEASNNQNMKTFASAYQIYIRKNYPVFLIMTGLYDNIYKLQNDKSMTFMYRAPKIMLEPLNYTSIIAHYQKVFGITSEKAMEMAKLTKGYSYAFQVLGYLLWGNPGSDIDEILPEYDQYLEEYSYDKIWSELSDIDQKVLKYMAESREEDVTSIRKALDMSTEKFSVYRDRLKKKGIINTPRYGSIAICLPRFDHFIKIHM